MGFHRCACVNGNHSEVFDIQFLCNFDSWLRQVSMQKKKEKENNVYSHLCVTQVFQRVDHLGPGINV